MRNFTATCLILAFILCSGIVSAKEPDYELYEKALSAHLKNGSVDYTALSKDQNFKTFVKELREFDRSNLKTKDEKKAFFINLYNALTLELIIKNMPLKTIKDIWRPWGKKIYVNGGDKFSLDHIEHKILRPMGDYRIHFAINCASIGCPDLRPEAYRASKLKTQLADQMELFLTNKSKGVDISESGVAEVSKIFSWFKKDFGGSDRVLNILRAQHPQGAKIKKLSYKRYNWNLNGK